MKNPIKLAAACMTAIILSSCSIFSPVKMGPDSGYVINTTPHHVVQSRHGNHILLVMAPDINPAFNTTRMAFTTKPYQISYYSQSHWVEPPADMLSPLLVRTLQKTNHFKNVISPPFAGVYQYALRTEIKSLLIDYTKPCPVLQMTLEEQIISAPASRLIASREFSASVPLRHRTSYGAVVAANEATASLLSEIAGWVIHKTR